MFPNAKRLAAGVFPDLDHVYTFGLEVLLGAIERDVIGRDPKQTTT